MKVTSHIKISSVLGVGVYAYTDELLPSVACFLGGWLIDLDHFLDWGVNYGLTPDYNRVVINFARNRVRHIYVIFHGWEYFIALFTLHILYGLPPWAFYAALGGACHLALDQIYNGPKRPLAYFITFRLYKRFRSHDILLRIAQPAPVQASGQAVHSNVA